MREARIPAGHALRACLAAAELAAIIETIAAHLAAGSFWTAAIRLQRHGGSGRRGSLGTLGHPDRAPAVPTGAGRPCHDGRARIQERTSVRWRSCARARICLSSDRCASGKTAGASLPVDLRQVRSGERFRADPPEIIPSGRTDRAGAPLPGCPLHARAGHRSGRQRPKRGRRAPMAAMPGRSRSRRRSPGEVSSSR